MNVTPFGAKSPTGTVIGVAADADGNLITTKKWQNEIVTILDAAEYRDTVRHEVEPKLDLRDAAAVSLRVVNNTDKPFKLLFYDDAYPSNHYSLATSSGELLSHTVKVAATPHIIITPDDIPELMWMMYLKLIVQFTEAPTEGSLTIRAVIKR